MDKREVFLFNDRYKITPSGLVISLPKKLGYGAYTRERILKPSKTLCGYVSFCIRSDKNKKKNFLLHRLLAESFIPNQENKPYVNHKDGNKLNNNLSNLEWVTAKENSQHAWDNRLQISTDKMKNQAKLNILKTRKVNRKLSFKTAEEIRDRYLSTNISQRKLAKEYNVAHHVITLIVNNKTYLENV